MTSTKRILKTTREFKFESTGMYIHGRPVFKVFELDKAGRNWLFYGRLSFDKGSSHEKKVNDVLWYEIGQEM